MTDLQANYMHDQVIAARRVLRHIAERQPLMYLYWLGRAAYVHEPCPDPDCLICAHIRELTIPLHEELDEVSP